MRNVYFVPKFPIDKLISFSEEGWVHDPNHIRNQYRYLEAIIEHINNDICEPVLVTHSQNQFSPGPHGVNRLMAIIRHTNWTTFPAVLNCEALPEFVINAEEIKNVNDLQKYFHRNLTDPNVAEVTFSERGVNIGSWNSFSILELAKTFRASPVTKERILELFAIEHIENGTLDTTNIDPIQLEKWQQAHSRWKNGKTSF